MKERLLREIPKSSYNGAEDTQAAPHILNMSFPVARAEVLLHALEGDQIYLSAGSACSAKKRQPSPVLTAMGLSLERLNGAIRISLSPLNTDEEINFATEKIISHVRELEQFKIR